MSDIARIADAVERIEAFGPKGHRLDNCFFTTRELERLFRNILTHLITSDVTIANRITQLIGTNPSIPNLITTIVQHDPQVLQTVTSMVQTELDNAGLSISAIQNLIDTTLPGAISTALTNAGISTSIIQGMINTSVSTALQGYLPLTGGTLTGPLVHPGVTNGSTPVAGQVGEAVGLSSGPIGIAAATPSLVSQLNVTAGDWLAQGMITLTPGGASPSGVTCWVSWTGDASANMGTSVNLTQTMISSVQLATPNRRLLTNAPATFNLYVQTDAGATVNASTIWAWRMR
jgi:hypothetical protein